MSTGLVCLCLQDVSVCVYRACLYVWLATQAQRGTSSLQRQAKTLGPQLYTEHVCLCLQANGQTDRSAAPAAWLATFYTSPHFVCKAVSECCCNALSPGTAEQICDRL